MSTGVPPQEAFRLAGHAGAGAEGVVQGIHLQNKALLNQVVVAPATAAYVADLPEIPVLSTFAALNTSGVAIGFVTRHMLNHWASGSGRRR
ncbi:MAG: hypothetical protein ACRDPW_02305 [Mycobacteriales bacterium]